MKINAWDTAKAKTFRGQKHRPWRAQRDRGSILKLHVLQRGSGRESTHLGGGTKGPRHLKNKTGNKRGERNAGSTNSTGIGFASGGSGLKMEVADASIVIGPDNHSSEREKSTPSGHPGKIVHVFMSNGGKEVAIKHRLSTGVLGSITDIESFLHLGPETAGLRGKVVNAHISCHQNSS